MAYIGSYVSTALNASSFLNRFLIAYGIIDATTVHFHSQEGSICDQRESCDFAVATG